MLRTIIFGSAAGGIAGILNGCGCGGDDQDLKCHGPLIGGEKVWMKCTGDNTVKLIQTWDPSMKKQEPSSTDEGWHGKQIPGMNKCGDKKWKEDCDKLENAKSYPQNHFDCTNKEDRTKYQCTVFPKRVSHYFPGATAEMKLKPSETVSECTQLEIQKLCDLPIPVPKVVFQCSADCQVDLTCKSNTMSAMKTVGECKTSFNCAVKLANCISALNNYESLMPDDKRADATKEACSEATSSGDKHAAGGITWV